MGRVSKYKKVKSCDPFSKANKMKKKRFDDDGEDPPPLWGNVVETRKKKKRSATATKLRQQKLNRKRKRGVGIGGVGDDADAFDLPPEGGDDFDLSDLIGSVRRETRNGGREGGVVDLGGGTSPSPSLSPSTFSKSGGCSVGGDVVVPSKPVAHVPQTDKEERRMARDLVHRSASKAASRRNAPSSSSSGVAPSGGSGSSTDGRQPIPALRQGGRMEGESMRAFDRRIRLETAEIMRRELHAKDIDAGKRNPAKAERKKEFMKRKKKMKKNKRGKGGGRGRVGDDGGSSDDDNGDDLVTAERAVATTMAFGERADRPPVFQVLPRGATKLRKKTKRSPSDEAFVLGCGGATDDDGGAKRQRVGEKKATKIERTRTTMSEEEVQAERNAMEAMRRRVQAQYALVREERMRRGAR